MNLKIKNESEVTMKILFMIPALSYSGAPKMLSWVANQMTEKEHEVSVVSFFSDIAEHNLNERVKLHCLNIKQSKKRIIRNTVGMFKTIRALHKYVKSYNPDLIVSFLDSVGYVYLGYNKIFGRRKIVVSERVDPYQYKGFISKVRFWLMKKATASVFQTDGAREYFKKYPKIYGNSTVIPNPVFLKEDIQQNLSNYEVLFTERDNRIVTVGRLSLKQKRQDVLIDAFEKVHKIHPELKLVIYGDGESKQSIEDIIKSKNLEDSVVLAGKTLSVEKEIYNARAFVLSSDFEGIPNSLIEALALGVPSVATDCSPGGARLLIKDGENGFLVDRGNSNSLAEKLLELVENEETSNKFSQNAPKIINEFSEEKIASMWENYFIKTINSK